MNTVQDSKMRSEEMEGDKRTRTRTSKRNKKQPRKRKSREPSNNKRIVKSETEVRRRNPEFRIPDRKKHMKKHWEEE